MSREVIELEIDDDSGLLGLVVSSQYKSFVDNDWTYEQILDHFAEQISARNILVWECGDGGNLYRVQIAAGFSDAKGYREIIGTINPVNGQLHLASYTALTMAAQFDDYQIPSDDEASLFFNLDGVPTKIRVIQMYNPKSSTADDTSAPHFLIEYEPGEADGWKEVAWESNRAPSDLNLKKNNPVSKLFSGLFRKGK